MLRTGYIIMPVQNYKLWLHTDTFVNQLKTMVKHSRLHTTMKYGVFNKLTRWCANFRKQNAQLSGKHWSKSIWFHELSDQSFHHNKPLTPISKILNTHPEFQEKRIGALTASQKTLNLKVKWKNSSFGELRTPSTNSIWQLQLFLHVIVFMFTWQKHQLRNNSVVEEINTGKFNKAKNLEMQEFIRNGAIKT